MKKSILLACTLFVAGSLFGAGPDEIPYELRVKIVDLYLHDIQISYKSEAPYYIGVIGYQNDERKAFVAIQYVNGVFEKKWSSFYPIPFEQENDTFALFSQEDKIVVIQSNSERDHENAIGYQILFDYTFNSIVIERIDPSRFILKPADTLLSFLR
jgi:hypothetical protein